MNRRTYIGALTLFLALAGFPGNARAGQGVEAGEGVEGHDHRPLEVDPALTLGAVVDAALAVIPDTYAATARREEADAWVERGDRLLAGRPQLMLRYQSDQFGSDAGLEEYEAGIELPMWRWGGRDAVRDFGAAMTAESGAAAAVLRWSVAGQVRVALWQVAIAHNEHELAEQSLDTADHLRRVVERRFELGDVALGDVLLAKDAYLASRSALIEADAALLDAERTYRSLTGLDRRPDRFDEALSQVTQIDEQHPALVFANAAVARAEADIEVVEKTTSTGARVLIGGRRERPANGTVLDDSVGITVSVPFGGESHRRPQISAAATAASMARAERNRQLRSLTLALHEAAHGLNVVRDNRAAAAERLEYAEQLQGMGELAYEKGELALMDLLRIQATTIDARRQATRLGIEERRQTALYNHSVGEIP